jgi:hypothetical protein
MIARKGCRPVSPVHDHNALPCAGVAFEDRGFDGLPVNQLQSLACYVPSLPY